MRIIVFIEGKHWKPCSDSSSLFNLTYLSIIFEYEIEFECLYIFEQTYKLLENKDIRYKIGKIKKREKAHELENEKF